MNEKLEPSLFNIKICEPSPIDITSILKKSFFHKEVYKYEIKLGLTNYQKYISLSINIFFDPPLARSSLLQFFKKK